MAATETRRIVIKMDTEGARSLKAAADALGGVNKNTKSLADSMSGLTNVFKGWAAFMGLNQFADMADQVLTLNNQLKNIAGSAAEAQATFEAITKSANENYVSIKTAGDTYNRFSLALKGYGATAGEVVDLVDLLSKTFRTAGSTTEETSNAMIQLSQAFSTGVLRGQDLKSVISQNVVIAAALRKEYGSSLFKEAENGAITISAVMKILSGIQEEVNQQAKNMSPTFAQTLTKAFNVATVAIGKFSKELDLQGKFATLVDGLTTSFGALIGILTGAAMAKAIQSVITLGVAVAGMEASTLAIGGAWAALAISFAATGNYMLKHWDEVKRGFQLTMSDIYAFLAQFQLTVSQFRDLIGNKSGAEEARKAAKDYLDAAVQANKAADEIGKSIEALSGNVTTLAERVKKAVPEVETLRGFMLKFNKDFLDGTITVDQYNKKIDALAPRMEGLNKTIKGFPEDLEKLRAALAKNGIEETTKLFNKGIITLDEYQKRVDGFTIAKLNSELATGKLTLQKYNEELLKLPVNAQNVALGLSVGIERFATSAGNLANQTASFMDKTLNSVGDFFSDFIKEGKASFEDFAKSVIDDLQRIIVKAAIVAPLARGLMSLGGLGAGPGGTISAGGSYAPVANMAAKGMAFDSGVRKFAKGGIVDSPTGFTYGNNKRGLMGEAGTEAIIPLQRAGNGDLGVAAQVNPVTINILNQSGAEVSQKETTGPSGEKTIDIIIASKVRDGILTGKFDTAMSAAYGVRRKGG